MSELFNQIKEQQHRLTDLQKRAYQAGYDAGYKQAILDKDKIERAEAEKDEANLKDLEND